ncbi:MAG: hypothetical protein ABFS34_15445 [Gemmatimonadota bacterium]
MTIALVDSLTDADLSPSGAVLPQSLLAEALEAGWIDDVLSTPDAIGETPGSMRFVLSLPKARADKLAVRMRMGRVHTCPGIRRAGQRRFAAVWEMMLARSGEDWELVGQRIVAIT